MAKPEPMTTRPPDAPRSAAYLCFTDDHDVVSAVSSYVVCHAHKPRCTWTEKHLLWLGPCIERDGRRPLGDKEND